MEALPLLALLPQTVFFGAGLDPNGLVGLQKLYSKQRLRRESPVNQVNVLNEVIQQCLSDCCTHSTKDENTDLNAGDTECPPTSPSITGFFSKTLLVCDKIRLSRERRMLLPSLAEHVKASLKNKTKLFKGCQKMGNTGRGKWGAPVVPHSIVQQHVSVSRNEKVLEIIVVNILNATEMNTLKWLGW